MVRSGVWWRSVRAPARAVGPRVDLLHVIGPDAREGGAPEPGRRPRACRGGRARPARRQCWAAAAAGRSPPAACPANCAFVQSTIP
jgi:hypothetical protein